MGKKISVAVSPSPRVNFRRREWWRCEEGNGEKLRRNFERSCFNAVFISVFIFERLLRADLKALAAAHAQWRSYVVCRFKVVSDAGIGFAGLCDFPDARWRACEAVSYSFAPILEGGCFGALRKFCARRAERWRGIWRICALCASHRRPFRPRCLGRAVMRGVFLRRGAYFDDSVGRRF